MRNLVLALATIGSLGACATQHDLAVETGTTRGSLAVAAIDRGDMAAAEHLLTNSSLPADDPARLINLGYVHMAQGRTEAAVAAWRAALASPAHRMVETMSGREARTDEIARRALARHQRVIASAD